MCATVIDASVEVGKNLGGIFSMREKRGNLAR
jgi:hypothetical protein